MSIAANIALQSWCLRKVSDNQEVIRRVQELGLKRIELCGVHVDFSKSETFDDVIGLYRDAGIQIVSIGVNSFRNDEAAERKLFEFARKAALRSMSADLDLRTWPDSLQTADRLAQEYGVNLAVHNHGGRHWLGAAAVLEWVFSQASERIGLCLDTAWALHSHYDPLKMAEQFADRLYGIHVKDFVFDRAGRPQDVVVGTGNLNLPALFDALEDAQFDGYAVLEYEGDPDDPMPALRQCVEAIRAEL